ncbi:hypothetical protein CEUSTIGMA_g5622.t1 [Chlamydomonas eustigma]|uniref:Uncharacterized protein n=1 Tax=Chlamydomonas eustigma TaxID=1157962 RepID=A0A250X5Z4_9CHLO|nr:hypothetical protein CEUSTIGMA_g5622.t1 [Chlamydomonas eustigma]|eukprot:GAX78180.1 hypothetical protein CEUSTIGMA_g5622.t1 [Chlamydomonas eustigma]
MSAFRQMDELEKGERQRVWDSIRASAWTRYQNGEMPPWFKLEWIMQEEAPLNRMLRLEDYEASLANATATGGGDDGGKSGGGSGSWKGPWREEDPYWPLRDWGDHPMRWWTLAFAAVLAVGGVMGYTSHGCAESLFVGGAAAALLSTCAMAMSDMTDWGHGQLAAKAAFAICAALAIKEIFFGWTHRPVPDWSSEYRWRTASKVPGSYTQLGNTGFFCMVMCMAYMLTDLSGLDEWALPITPGAVYKGTDVAFKQRVWEKWGYGDMPMRPP